MSDFLVVMTTFESKEDAERVAKLLLREGLSACIQILGPIKSFFRWKGKEEEAEEWLCLMKTRAELYGRLEELLLREHPYETPEVVALPIVRGSEGYLSWLMEETGRY